MTKGGVSGAKDGARRTTRRARPWIERVAQRVARFGYAAYGVVYVLVGVLSVRAALGAGGKTAGQEGALQTILLAPLGRVLLGLVALGLLGYAMWRLFQGALDPDGEGKDAKGLVKRSDHVVNGLFHAASVAPSRPSQPPTLRALPARPRRLRPVHVRRRPLPAHRDLPGRLVVGLFGRGSG